MLTGFFDLPHPVNVLEICKCYTLTLSRNNILVIPLGYYALFYYLILPLTNKISLYRIEGVKQKVSVKEVTKNNSQSKMSLSN